MTLQFVLLNKNNVLGESGLERIFGCSVYASPVLGIFGQRLYLELYLGDIQGGPLLGTAAACK